MARSANHTRAKPAYGWSEAIKLFALVVCAAGLGLNYLPKRTPERVWLSSRLCLALVVVFPAMRCLAASTMSVELLQAHAAALAAAAGCSLPCQACQVSLAGVVTRMQYGAHQTGWPCLVASFGAYAAGSATIFMRLERDRAGSAPLPGLLVATFGLLVGYIAYDRVERKIIRPKWQRSQARA